MSQVQEEAARQQAPHAQVGYGKVNPPGGVGVVGGQPQVMPPPQIQRAIGQMSTKPMHLMPMDQWTRYSQTTVNLKPLKSNVCCNVSK